MASVPLASVVKKTMVLRATVTEDLIAILTPLIYSKAQRISGYINVV